VNEESDSVEPGDLVTLANIGKIKSMVMWAAWNDLEHSTQEIKFWPIIVGKLKRGELAFVLQTYSPRIGYPGAKICTSKKLVGWIGCAYLTKINKGPD